MYSKPTFLCLSKADAYHALCTVVVTILHLPTKFFKISVFIVISVYSSYQVFL